MKYVKNIIIIYITTFIKNAYSFKALDSYKMDSGEFPFQADGQTDVTKILTRFYVKEDGTCKKFYYKGSGGNSNNFGTEHECLEHLADLSKWETLEGCKEGYISKGPCSNSGITKYGYVASLGTCTDFQYGGCGGNSNRFATENDCQRACEVGDKKAPNLYDCDLSPKYPLSDEVKVSIVKSQDLQQTKCHYAIVDKAETRGIFPTFSKCLTTCFTDSLIGACKKDIPDQETTSGGTQVVKFYYHKTNGTCIPFLTMERTGEFDKEKNYFNTEEECMSYCPVAEDKINAMSFQVSKDACSLLEPPPNTGSLTGLKKWYYKNGETPGCTEITHGGIGDMYGLFDTLNECNMLCGNGAE